MPLAFTLHAYQNKAVDALEAAITEGRHGLIHVPTGGGKTVIAAEVLRCLGPGRVLWVTKDWLLLKQAMETIRAQAPHLRLGRIGGDLRELGDLQEAGSRTDVAFTTLQTFGRRTSAIPMRKPRVIVWDECHWADGSKLGRQLVRYAKRAGAVLIGLTATPRGYSSLPTLFSESFGSLVAGRHLARPVIDTPVDTGYTWAAERSSATTDFTAASLNRLADDTRRNASIADQWRANARRYGKTLVFACNIKHAVMLANLFKLRGAAVGVVHHHMSPRDVENEVSRYHRGELEVLINVTMLTHGFDSPETKTVFLTRPTASLTLYAQMIGRGSRIVAGQKDTFNIVEFTDNVKEHHDAVLRPESVVGAALARPRPLSRRFGSRPATSAHHFAPEGRMRLFGKLAHHADMQGLSYREGQTFGVELELTRTGFDPQSREVIVGRSPRMLIKSLSEALAKDRVCPTLQSYHGSESHVVWNIEQDASCGLEAVSPILRDPEGFSELCLALEAIGAAAKSAELKLSHLTGFHLHLGWSGDYRALQRLVRVVHELEPMLATLVAPSRIAQFDGEQYSLSEGNPYCAPISSIPGMQRLLKASSQQQFDETLAGMNEDECRYATVNLIPLAAQSTIEIRMHSGTLEAAKVLTWISLWMVILQHCEGAPHAAASSAEPLGNRSVIEPAGCIVRWLETNVGGSLDGLLNRLHTRRLEVLGLWKGNAALNRWAHAAQCWQSPSRAA